MESRFVPAREAIPLAGRDAPAGSDLGARVLRLQARNEALERELGRAHEQLTLVFDVSSSIATVQDPAAIQRELLRRCAEMLRAAALFLDCGGCCSRIDLPPAGCGGVSADITPECVRRVLGSAMENVRRSRRAQPVELSAEAAAALSGARVLLGALARTEAEPGVIVALRSAGQPPFDGGDVLAVEAVLAYGAQILGGVLTLRHLQRAAVETVCTLVNAIDAKDNYTSDHSERVGGLARLTGQALGLPQTQLQGLEWAGLLHDIGKIGVSERILNKPGVLTRQEFEQMQRHPRIGYKMLKPVAQFAPMLDAVLYHHENHDGSGYPGGLRGEEVPLDARIIHVVDIFDALTTNRPYRDSYDFAQALALIERGAGRVTDPDVTRLFGQTLRRLMTERPEGFRTWFAHLIECGGEVPAGARVHGSEA